MGYYCGDFYQGDFYQGDPGFFGGLVRFGRRAIGAGVKLLPGPVGAVARGVSAAITKHPVISAAGAAGIGGAAVSAGAARMGGRMGAAQVGPAGLGAGGVRGMGPALMEGAGGARGYHMSKPRKCGGMIIPSHLVRNRRMRVTNPRALRRAIRRARGFERMARKVMHFVSPRKTKGRAVFHAKKRTK